MQSEDLRRQIETIGKPFWLVLDNGEQVCCQKFVGLDNAALTVIVGREPRMILLHQIKECSGSPLSRGG
jgi:hypothetical protein